MLCCLVTWIRNLTVNKIFHSSVPRVFSSMWKAVRNEHLFAKTLGCFLPLLVPFVSVAAFLAVQEDGGGGIHASVTTVELEPHSPLNAALARKWDRQLTTSVLFFVCTNPGCTSSRHREFASWIVQLFKPLEVEKGLIMSVYCYITDGNSGFALRISTAVSAQNC